MYDVPFIIIIFFCVETKNMSFSFRLVSPVRVCVCVLKTSNKDFPFMHKICRLKIYKRKPPETPTKMARTIRTCRRTHVLVHAISKNHFRWFTSILPRQNGCVVVSTRLHYLSVRVCIPWRALAHIQNTQNKNILGYTPYTVIILWEWNEKKRNHKIEDAEAAAKVAASTQIVDDFLCIQWQSGTVACKNRRLLPKCRMQLRNSGRSKYVNIIFCFSFCMEVLVGTYHHPNVPQNSMYISTSLCTKRCQVKAKAKHVSLVQFRSPFFSLYCVSLFLNRALNCRSRRNKELVQHLKWMWFAHTGTRM